MKTIIECSFYAYMIALIVTLSFPHEEMMNQEIISEFWIVGLNMKKVMEKCMKGLLNTCVMN